MDSKTGLKVMEILVDRFDMDVVDLLSSMVTNSVVSVGAMLEAVAEASVSSIVVQPTAANHWLFDDFALSQLSHVVVTEGKIPAIKYLRELHRAMHGVALGLKEAKDYVEANYNEKFERHHWG